MLSSWCGPAVPGRRTAPSSWPVHFRNQVQARSGLALAANIGDDGSQSRSQRAFVCIGSRTHGFWAENTWILGIGPHTGPGWWAIRRPELCSDEEEVHPENHIE